MEDGQTDKAIPEQREGGRWPGGWVTRYSLSSKRRKKEPSRGGEGKTICAEGTSSVLLIRAKREAPNLVFIILGGGGLIYTCDGAGRDETNAEGGRPHTRRARIREEGRGKRGGNRWRLSKVREAGREEAQDGRSRGGVFVWVRRA